MLLNRQQLALSLCQLTQHDYELLNEVIIEYVSMLPTTRMHDLHDFTSKEIENDWGRG